MNKSINNPIINSYIDEFVLSNEISPEKSIDRHTMFEMYINNLILNLYGNDTSSSFYDMETGSAFGIDGVAIFVADKFVKSTDDVDEVIGNIKKFDVEFYFIQSKTTNSFRRTDISDFLTGIIRFFNFNKCEIPELAEFWETASYIYSKATKFKNNPKLNMIFATLSPTEIDLEDIHLKSDIQLKIKQLNELGMFSKIENPHFINQQKIMQMHKKNTSDLEISIKMTKTPVAYPKDKNGKIKNGYYGLIRIKDFLNILTDNIDDKPVLRKGIFDDNIRYYLGSEEKIEVNYSMKMQLEGENPFIFGLLNNGITIICDEVILNSEDLSLINYQIVNGCQTSNVIFELIENIRNNDNFNDIYLPARFIATNDEDTKNSIIKATNSQTILKPEQIAALSSIQKGIEEYYNTKNKTNNLKIYYERRTEQYRDESIPKTKIISIPFQIKATSAMFLELPHEVSGQYGKVEKKTRGLLFNDSKDLEFLNVYYTSGLTWYKVERFVNNNYDRKFRRARWHIMMVISLLFDSKGKTSQKIDKYNNEKSRSIENIMLDESKSNIIIEKALDILKEAFESNEFVFEEVIEDRKLFERKETTDLIIKYIKEKQFDISSFI